jgi:hypothetical protein
LVRFGIVYLILQLVPVLSMLFLLTTAVGSSLWAVELEKEHRAMQALEEQDPDVLDPPPPYEDDPI